MIVVFLLIVIAMVSIAVIESRKMTKAFKYKAEYHKTIKEGDKCLIVHNNSYTNATIDKISDGIVTVKIDLPISNVLPLDYPEVSGIKYKN